MGQKKTYRRANLTIGRAKTRQMRKAKTGVFYVEPIYILGAKLLLLRCQLVLGDFSEYLLVFMIWDLVP